MKTLRRVDFTNWGFFLVLVLFLAAETRTFAGGIVLFTTPPADYPEIVVFTSLTKTGAVFSEARDSTGKRFEIPNAGIIGIIEDPPARPNAMTAPAAIQALQQINSVLRKYPADRFPEISSKLGPLAARWRTVQTIAQNNRATPGLPSTPAGRAKLTINTTDGQHYEDVVVTKVDTESISFEHSAGFAKIELAKLPPDLQKKFNYDPQKVAVAKAATLAEAKKENAISKPIPGTAPPSSNPDPIAPAKSEVENLAKAQALEFVKTWTEEAGTEIGPPTMPLDSAKFDNLPDGSPGYYKTLEFINSRLRRPGKMGYSEKLRKMVLLTSYGVAFAFDPVNMSSGVKYASQGNGLQTSHYLTLATRNNKPSIDVYEGTKEAKTTEFYLHFSDSVETEKMAKAFSHLLSMLGAEADLF